MTAFLETLANGVSLGCIYTLLSLGFVVIYRSTHVVNFAHGSVMLLGIVVVAELVGTIGFWLALLVGLAAVVALTVVVQRFLVTPLRRRGAGHDTALIMTLGVDLILLTELTRRIGSRVLDVGAPWGTAIVRIGAVSLPLARVLALVVCVVLVGAFYAVLRLTDWGVSTRAAAEDGEAAALMGIRLDRTASVAWALAGALALVAGLFLTSLPAAGFTAGVAVVALNAFPAAVIGGIDSIEGALLGGLLVGVVETFVTAYGAELEFLGTGFGAIAPWVLMLLVLLVRPSGLLGTKEVARV